MFDAHVLLLSESIHLKHESGCWHEMHAMFVEHVFYCPRVDHVSGLCTSAGKSPQGPFPPNPSSTFHMNQALCSAGHVCGAHREEENPEHG